MIFLGWILWAITGVIALTGLTLFVQNATKTRRASQGFISGRVTAIIWLIILLIAFIAVPFCAFSKLHLLWFIPASFIATLGVTVPIVLLMGNSGSVIPRLNLMNFVSRLFGWATRRSQPPSAALSVSVLSITRSVSKVGGKYRFQIRVEGDNKSDCPLGWSGVTINVPTIDSHERYLATEIQMASLGCNEPSRKGPGDLIFGFRDDGSFGEKTATCLFMECVREQWPPHERIALEAVLLAPFSRLDLQVRVWSNRPENGGAFGDPDWKTTKQQKDQQGIPAYPLSLRVGLLGEFRNFFRRSLNSLMKNGALREASRAGDVKVVRWALLEGADKQAKTRLGESPLHLAASNGHASVVELLIDSGDDKDAKAKDGGTALHLAALNGHAAVVGMLIKAGADKEVKSRGGLTPLHLGALNGHVPVVEVLVRAGADKDVKDGRGFTPLHVGVLKGHASVVELLVRAGADKDAKSGSGFTPLRTATAFGHASVEEILRKAGAQISTKQLPDDLMRISVLSMTGSVSRVGDRYRFQIRVEGENKSDCPLGWSGVTINVPTIDSCERYLTTEIQMSSLGCNEPSRKGPGDVIFGFRDDGSFGEKTATCLFMECVREQWPPHERIALEAVLLAPFSRLDLQVRVWSNRPENGGAFGDPDWKTTKQQKDQQGIPAYSITLRFGLLGVLKNFFRRIITNAESRATARQPSSATSIAPKSAEASTWSLGQEASPAVSSAPALAQEARQYFKANPSNIFPDFPLNPQNLFYEGGLIKDAYLLNICIIGQCIFSEFEIWMNQAGPQKWPQYADRELAALKRACGDLGAKVPSGTSHSIDIANVRQLIRSYIERIKSNDEAYANFMGARYTLLCLSVDFAHTIACGSALQTALEWHQAGW